MIDDLVKRLWESDEASALTNQAARRIEELEAKLDLSEGALDVASKSWGECQRILEQTEAKLAKAVGGLNSIAANTCCNKCQEAALVARSVLAELKGETDA